jgi:hypothetical protein
MRRGPTKADQHFRLPGIYRAIPPVASQPNSEQGISDREYRGVESAVPPAIPLLGIAFGLRLLGRSRILFNGSLESGHNYHYFVAKSVE